MNGILNKAITLSLNKIWKPIGYTSVQDAIVKLTGSEIKPKPSMVALDIQYEVNEDGTPMFNQPTVVNPVTWEEWISLPIRDWDLTISGANGKLYRVPTVIVAVNYDKMPRKEYNDNPSNQCIFERDNNICAYTGEKLSRENMTVDHIIPRNRGGGEGWDNKVTCRKDLNHKKGNKLNSEIGYKLLKQPFKPKAIDFMFLINEARNHDHEHFLY
jgi:5-methylcytosine-specific restriction endonuclease McrA